MRLRKQPIKSTVFRLHCRHFENGKCSGLTYKLFSNFPAIFTARKRSLGQGNIFRSVCQDFCPQGGAWSWGGAWSGGCLVPGGCLVLGGLQSHNQGEELRGIWSRPTTKGKAQGDLVSPPPPRWLLLQLVHILLECILVWHNIEMNS